MNTEQQNLALAERIGLEEELSKFMGELLIQHVLTPLIRGNKGEWDNKFTLADGTLAIMKFSKLSESECAFIIELNAQFSITYTWKRNLAGDGLKSTTTANAPADPLLYEKYIIAILAAKESMVFVSL